MDDLIYNNTLLVYPDQLGVSVNVTCIAMYEGVYYRNTVILQGMSNLNVFICFDSLILAPSGPPLNCESIYIK